MLSYTTTTNLRELSKDTEGKGTTLQKRVLVIEDSPSQAAVTRLQLENLGYDVAIGYTGNEGLNAAKTFQPSIIILDCNLPDMSGVEVCRLLKSQPETRPIPVVMFSVENKLAQMSSAYSAGADHYVTKDREGSNGLLKLVEAVYQRRSRQLGRS